MWRAKCQNPTVVEQDISMNFKKQTDCLSKEKYEGYLSFSFEFLSPPALAYSG
jgi:hypothetical protein